jgi:hypothetical protein
VPRRGGWVVRPERVDETLDGNRLVGSQEKVGEQRTLLRRAELDRLAFDERFERAEEAEVDALEANRRGLSSLALSVH